MTDLAKDQRSTEDILAEEEAKVQQELEGGQADEATSTEGEDEVSSKQGEEAPSDEDQPLQSETETEDDLSDLSARAQKRIAKFEEKLSAKDSQIGNLQAEIDDLKKRLTPQPHVETPGKLPWDQEEETQEDPETVARRVVREEKWVDTTLSTLQTDVKGVEEKYPQLRPDSDVYDQNLVDLVQDLYTAKFEAEQKRNKDNPNWVAPRLSELVDNLMSLRKSGAEEGRKQTQATIKKQEAEQAIDPAGSPTTSRNDNLEGKISGAKSMNDLAELEKLLPHAD